MDQTSRRADGDRFLYPRVPEILSKAAAIIIAREAVAAKSKSPKDMANLYKAFILRCDGLPLPDVVGASALQEIFSKSSALLGKLVKIYGSTSRNRQCSEMARRFLYSVLVVQSKRP
jgi:hypothetical protein